MQVNRVFVLDKNKQPLMPCHPARARELLKGGKAAIYRRQPFTIILKIREGGDTQPLTVKLDPGSRTTGIAVVVDGKRGKRVVWAAHLAHRGAQVKSGLQTRSAQRHSRRARHTRYRPARYLNRRRATGWLPPSLESRIGNTHTWTQRLMRGCPVTSIALEVVKFDTQLMQDAEVSDVAYQQGTLHGYEVRHYLLEKWQRTCAYCGKRDVPLEIEHLTPRSRGGSDRVSNLTLACHECNQAKGTQTAAEFGHPALHAQARQPLKDAAAVNATRWALYARLQALGLPLETGSGGRTQYNRIQQNYPKAHWIDAACVGASGEQVYLAVRHPPLCIRATGRQRRQMTLVDKFGFPRSKAKGSRFVHGFQTGDLVSAVVPTGKRQGSYRGRLAVKASGGFTVAGTPDIGWRCCRKLQSADGYDYKKGEAASPVA